MVNPAALVQFQARQNQRCHIIFPPSPPHSLTDKCGNMTTVQPAGSVHIKQYNDTQRGRAASLPSAEFCARLFSICMVSGEDSATLSLSKQGTVFLLHDKHCVCENMHYSFDCGGKFFSCKNPRSAVGNGGGAGHSQRPRL